MKVYWVNHGTGYSVSGGTKMWLLLTVASLISALGTTHGFRGKLNSESPEVTMNIVSYQGEKPIKLRDIAMI